LVATKLGIADATEPMIAAHAAQLEDAAGAAATEVLRVTELLERARGEAGEAKRHLAERVVARAYTRPPFSSMYALFVCYTRPLFGLT
jgi:hypothetical protein